MSVLLRSIGVLVLITIVFHITFVSIHNLSLLRPQKYEDIVSAAEFEHSARLRHLNATLTLLNNELKLMNISLHSKIPDYPLNLRVVPLEIPSEVPRKVYREKSALVFTMDSISSYEDAAHHGGASGEIIIRKSLENAFDRFNVKLDVIRSDQEFERKSLVKYDFILLDPWTWAAKGWVPKRNIRGLDNKVFILDFFGSEKLRGSGLNVHPKRFLTAFGSPWNSFLGYYIPPLKDNIHDIKKINQGIIWGKDIKHFDGKSEILRTASKFSVLQATIPAYSTYSDLQIRWIGHQSHDQWITLLSQSKFLLGLGNPLLGPSAIDAISVGCMYINPIYDTPMRDVFKSQHPYADSKIGEPYVCSYRMSNMEDLEKCITKALSTDLKPMIPSDFTETEYFNRVKKIFDL